MPKTTSLTINLPIKYYFRFSADNSATSGALYVPWLGDQVFQAVEPRHWRCCGWNREGCLPCHILRRFWDEFIVSSLFSFLGDLHGCAFWPCALGCITLTLPEALREHLLRKPDLHICGIELLEFEISPLKPTISDTLHRKRCSKKKTTRQKATGRDMDSRDDY